MIGVEWAERPSWVVPRESPPVPDVDGSFLLENSMSKDFVIQANLPSRIYIASMAGIALAGTIGLPLMLWLIFTSIFSHKWPIIIVALLTGLICGGMLQFWKSVRSAVRQRQDSARHSITVAEQKFVYRKDDAVREIPLADILGVKDRVEGRGGTVEIVYRKQDESHGTLSVTSADFSNAWEKQGKFGALLWEAIQANRD
jgi:hypothetical protein